MAGPETLSIDCESCGAQLLVEPELRTTRCPYCDSPSVVERPPTPDRPEPAFVLGFVIDEKRARQHLRNWLGRHWLAPSGFKRATVEHTRGVYLPTYLYGAVAETDYTANIGENYTTTETYTTTVNGKTVTRTRTVVKTEWRELAGSHACYIMDIIVTASRGIPNADLEEVEPFDLGILRRYHPAMIAGWIAEEPSMKPEECQALAQEESLQAIGRELTTFMPGDKHTDLQYRTSLSDQMADLTLLPLWVFAVRGREDREPVRVLVNGQSGKTFGKLPLSWVKIALLALSGAGLIAGGVALVLWGG